MSKLSPSLKICVAVLLLLLAGPAIVACSGVVKLGQDWRTADRSPAGIAPDPADTDEAIVQVYAARAINRRALVAVHTWIATKAKGAKQFRVHQVIGWNLYSNRAALESGEDFPDRSWYGADPEVLIELRGAEAETAITQVEAAVASYPWPRDYTTWPGPNSNTFVAYVARRAPALKLDLPPTAIGKDFLGGRVFADAPSGTGYQLSLFGLLGVTVARVEGLEINLLGLAFGANPVSLKLRLPGVGIVAPD